jgi:hypothetical protein
MKAYKGTFVANTATGNQTISGIVDESAAAFTPKAVLLWSSYATADVTFQDGFNFAFGMTDGTTSGSGSLVAQDNVATQRCGSRVDTVMACMNTATATTAVRSGAFVSFGSGQFVINWTVQDGVAAIWHYLALGGDDLDAAVVSQALIMARTAVTASFDVAANIQFSTQSGTANSTAQGALVATRESGAFNQGMWWFFLDDNISPANSLRFQRADQSVVIGNNNGSIDAVGAQDPLGMAYDVTNTNGNLTRKGLMVGGVLAAGGSGLQPAATGTQAVSGLGFSPKCVLIFSIGNVAIANKTSANDTKLSFGAADRTRQGFGYNANVDGQNPSVAVNYSDDGAIIAAVTPNATAASSTIDAQAAIQSVDADGFTLNWTAADATAREYVWLALGDDPNNPDLPGGGGGGGAHAATFFGI